MFKGEQLLHSPGLSGINNPEGSGVVKDPGQPNPVGTPKDNNDGETDRQPGRDAAIKHVMTNLHPGAVILLHAVSQSNAEALDDIIKGIREEGYSFGTLDDISN